MATKNPLSYTSANRHKPPHAGRAFALLYSRFFQQPPSGAPYPLGT
jgi:hypothetical protein